MKFGRIPGELNPEEKARAWINASSKLNRYFTDKHSEMGFNSLAMETDWNQIAIFKIIRFCDLAVS
jgi:hypothetical protein